MQPEGGQSHSAFSDEVTFERFEGNKQTSPTDVCRENVPGRENRPEFPRWKRA